MDRKKKIVFLIALLIPILTAGAFFAYTGQYYHADATAAAALISDRNVAVSQTDVGWFFDGPSEDDALIFYPGGKVEETAYAPLLRRLAEEGVDVFLVKMPFRLAVFGVNRADSVMERYDYPHWYLGGHSLGGVCAADYACGHSDRLAGVILLAAYPAKRLPEGLKTVLIYGTADGVLDPEKYAAGKQYAPADASEYVIEGGNHAQFGSYGLQKGDGEAAVSPAEQIAATVREILACV